MKSDRILRGVREYYDAHLRAAGPTPRGVDWNSAESQELRFQQLLRMWKPRRGQSILDYGCGYGALLTFLDREGLELLYTGFDVSRNMLSKARELHGPRSNVAFTDDVGRLRPADYVVASGIFNVRQDTGVEEWREYMETEIHRMDSLATLGLAFNALSTYSDPEKRRRHLYYAEPPALFDWCTRNLGGAVVLLHDYPLYEFTMVVAKGGSGWTS